MLVLGFLALTWQASRDFAEQSEQEHWEAHALEQVKRNREYQEQRSAIQSALYTAAADLRQYVGTAMADSEGNVQRIVDEGGAAIGERLTGLVVSLCESDYDLLLASPAVYSLAEYLADDDPRGLDYALSILERGIMIDDDYPEMTVCTVQDGRWRLIAQPDRLDADRMK